MVNGLFQLLGIYGFVLIGFIAKRYSNPSLCESSFVSISIYYLQPILIFWGILVKPLQLDIIIAPALFIGVLLVALLCIAPFRAFFHDAKDKSILSISSIVGNTGNLGIPLGLLLYGTASVPYTSMINLFNAVFIYTVGVYVYSRGSFSISQSFINVLKLPLIWAATLAFLVHLLHIPISTHLMKLLEMGAYAAIVIQLLILGIFISKLKIGSFHWSLVLSSSAIKCIALPLLGGLLLTPFHSTISALAFSCITLQLVMPIAANNINFASLYNCYPEKVAGISLVTMIGVVLFFFLGT